MRAQLLVVRVIILVRGPWGKGATGALGMHFLQIQSMSLLETGC